jgi:hypothetical protein
LSRKATHSRARVARFSAANEKSMGAAESNAPAMADFPSYRRRHRIHDDRTSAVYKPAPLEISAAERLNHNEIGLA